MAAKRFFARRSVRIVLAVAIGGNLLGGVGAAYILGGASDLTVDKALERFRRSRQDASSVQSPHPVQPGDSASPSVTPTATKSAPAKRSGSSPTGTRAAATPGTLSRSLEEGVYVFATDGYEETDALSGQRHDYKSETTMTINQTASNCYTWRWQPMEERWDESEACRRSTGIVLDRFSMYHEFFRRGIREDFDCGSDAVVMPREPRAGRSWTFRCKSDDSLIESHVDVVGFETLTIGGTRVRAVHMRYDTNMTGDNQGHHVQERWLAQDTGLLLRMKTDVSARVETPVGDPARYEEHYRIDLTSLEPRR